jgi:hypothetical protein
MNDWHPHTLQDCVGSEILGWLTAILALGMLCWYLAIAKRWYESLQLASEGGKAVWGWLVVIFIVCAMGGYVALIVMIWFPKTSVIFRISFLSIQNIACPFFWALARRYKFHLQGHYEKIGEGLSTAKIEDLTDHELATLTRKLVISALGRTAEKLAK